MRLASEELERIMKWYRSWVTETGSSEYDSDLVYKIKKYLKEN